MSKFSYEEKLEAVLRCLEDGMSTRESAHILGCNRKNVQQWVGLYQYHGTDGLVIKHGTYSSDFKLYVVEYIRREHVSPQSAAAIFGVPSKTTVAKWEHIYYEEGQLGLNKDNRGRQEKMKLEKPKKELNEQTKEDLIAEVQRLCMENEYLKKLRALVQERIARENGNEPPSSMN